MAAGNRKDPQRSESSESTYSLMEFMRDFGDDEACLTWLWNTRYATEDGTGAHCRKCGCVRVFERYATTQQRQAWTCTACGTHVHPTAGTIFHKSSTSLHLWFYAMYLMTSTRCGISAKQLERELGVTYKTAWRMFTLIRRELMTTEGEPPLSGVVEMDETYVGGTRKGRFVGNGVRARVGGRPAPGDPVKTPVFGMVERNGGVRAVVVYDVRRDTLFPLVRKAVDPGTTVYTDEFPVYKTLALEGYEHDTVTHSVGEYVRGDVSTNAVEGFWSLVKGGIKGVYRGVSPRYLQCYLNEYAWRYNHRHDTEAQFLSMLLASASVSVSR